MTYETKTKKSNLERLKRYKKEDKMTCFDCKNQTFILVECSDFPYFDVICSKCGSISILPAKN